ncbi:MAG TPA: 3-oxoacyl-[acyl-carrier-protein] synthase III C-terminal domain-containing protein [Candidatus Nanopelagicales bacterium]|jgi:predicted naringenin-chalcone synthase|nr:3-oxoacyl-[acyl-carrier-protein] synthase III C-terminal domain-containing protein [Candidatus Nanopelagicales bacterium]
MVSAPTVAGRAHAFPGTATQADLWEGFFADHYDRDRLAQRIFRSTGVVTRHAVVNPIEEGIADWSTGRRMERFLREAMPLGKEALAAALADAELDAEDVGLFAVTSCTGYATPGLDILLARDLGMGPAVQRLNIGHMGCYAALPALGSVADYVAYRSRPAVLLCLELTSLHLQPRSPAGEPVDMEQVVAHALFSDAASAVVLRPGGPGQRVVDVRAVTDVANAALMTWDVTDNGFRMGLSPQVPDVLARHVREAVDGMLAAHGLTVPDVAGWAVHPGGPRILDVVRDRLGLDEEALAASRAVLREHGNCSSATVLLVLDELRRTSPAEPGSYTVALAFGPGLTMYAVLLRQQ